MTNTHPEAEHDPTAAEVAAIFGEWGERRYASSPVHQRICEAVSADPSLAAPLIDWHTQAHSRPTPDTGDLVQPAQLFTPVQYLLRTTATDHPLAEFYPTLGGMRSAGRALVDAWRDFVITHHDRLVPLCGRAARQNDPQVWAQVRPGITWAAATHADGRPLALIELGAAAGLGLLPDFYRFDYGRVTIGDGPVTLECHLRGGLPPGLADELDIAERIGLELDPIDADQPDDADWLVSAVDPEETTKLVRLGGGLARVRDTEIDLRHGDMFDLLPRALAEVPDGHLPVVYGASVIAEADEPARMPRLLTDADRDLVWIMAEATQVSYPLVTTDPPPAYDDPTVGGLVAVVIQSGEVVDVVDLARLDRYDTWLEWDPRPLTPRAPSA